jgi:hypothetical protein
MPLRFSFIQQCWGENVKRTTMKSLAGKIEETRKEYGNSFNYIVSTISKRQYISLKMCPTNLCRILPLCGGLVSHLKNKLPSSIHKPCLAFSTSA